MRLGEYHKVIDSSIRQVARQFVRSGGEGAFDLYYEAEIEALLFGHLRRSPLMKVLDQDGCKRHLVHLHSTSLKRRFIDVVIWHPDEIDVYRRHWRNLPSTAPDFGLLAAIQLKRGPGRITPLDHVKKDLDDLTQVGKAEVNQRARLYFIMFVDHDLRESPSKDEYRVAKRTLELWCEKDAKRRRVLLLSRDRVGFAYPRGLWEVAVLPASVVADF